MKIDALLNAVTGQVAPHKAAQATPTPEQLRQHQKLVKAAQDFEAVFIAQMLKQVHKSISGEKPLFGGSQEAKMYQDMMDEATAQQMSRTGSFGLAKLLTKSLEHGPALAPGAEQVKR